MLGLVGAALITVTVLAVRAPLYALPVALVLLGFEGSIKMRLSIEDAPYAISLGAALIDLALFIGMARSHRQRPSAVAAAAVAARWSSRAAGGLCPRGLARPGSRADPAGRQPGRRESRDSAWFISTCRPSSAESSWRRACLPSGWRKLLLWVIAPVAAYAALRGIVGPTDSEREFVEMRTNNFEVGEAPRNSGSFTSSLGLASFLVPAGVFALAVAYLMARQRTLALVVFLLSMVGVVASYVRTALVAVVAGTAVVAALMVTGRRRVGAPAEIRGGADSAGPHRRLRSDAGGRNSRRAGRKTCREPPESAERRVRSDPLRYLAGIAREGDRQAGRDRARDRRQRHRDPRRPGRTIEMAT